MGFDFLDIGFIIMIFITAGMYFGKKDYLSNQIKKEEESLDKKKAFLKIKKTPLI